MAPRRTPETGGGRVEDDLVHVEYAAHGFEVEPALGQFRIELVLGVDREEPLRVAPGDRDLRLNSFPLRAPTAQPGLRRSARSCSCRPAPRWWLLAVVAGALHVAGPSPPAATRHLHRYLFDDDAGMVESSMFCASSVALTLDLARAMSWSTAETRIADDLADRGLTVFFTESSGSLISNRYF